MPAIQWCAPHNARCLILDGWLFFSRSHSPPTHWSFIFGNHLITIYICYDFGASNNISIFYFSKLPNTFAFGRKKKKFNSLSSRSFHAVLIDLNPFLRFLCIWMIQIQSHLYAPKATIHSWIGSDWIGLDFHGAHDFKNKFLFNLKDHLMFVIFLLFIERFRETQWQPFRIGVYSFDLST